MPKITVAERVLETVTTSDNASSIVGDLLEEASNKSRFWFWLGVLRIFASHLFCDLRNHWLRMTWLGFSEFLGFLIVLIAIAIMCSHVAPGGFPVLVNHILSNGLLILTGWHVARRSHGSELASGLAFVCMGSIYMGAMLLTATQREPLTMVLFKTLKYAFGSAPPVIIGVFVFRYRAKTRYRKQQLERS